MQKILETQSDEDSESLKKFLTQLKTAKDMKQTQEIITLKEEWQILKNSLVSNMAFEPADIPSMSSFGRIGDTKTDAKACIVSGNITPGFIERTADLCGLQFYN
jgi:hypothetical protein